MVRVPTGNTPAAVALVLGVLSIPGALTFLGGVVLGLAAIVAGFAGVARSDRMQGAGQGLAVAGVITGGLGMALATAIVLILAP